MPITKSVKKSLRTSLVKRARNITLKNKLKQSIKKVNRTNFSKVVSVIDKAAKKNIIHKNKAARLKSRLAKQMDPKTQNSTPKKSATPKKNSGGVKKSKLVKKNKTKTHKK